MFKKNYFDLEFFKGLQNSWPLNTKISPVLFFPRKRAYLLERKPTSFPTDRFPKNTATIHFVLTGLEGGLRSTLVDFFIK
jgi:hypothetical protein